MPTEAGSPTAVYRALIVLLDELLHALDNVPIVGRLIWFGDWRFRFCQYAHKED